MAGRECVHVGFEGGDDLGGVAWGGSAGMAVEPGADRPAPTRIPPEPMGGSVRGKPRLPPPAARLPLPLCGCSSNKEKIQGVWEVESGFDGLKEGTFEFTPDGKVKVGGNLAGQPFTDEGTYSIRGDVITFTMNLMKRSDKTNIVE